eukprot:scpid107476/ scgid16798/ 
MKFAIEDVAVRLMEPTVYEFMCKVLQNVVPPTSGTSRCPINGQFPLCGIYENMHMYILFSLSSMVLRIRSVQSLGLLSRSETCSFSDRTENEPLLFWIVFGKSDYLAVMYASPTLNVCATPCWY